VTAGDTAGEGMVDLAVYNPGLRDPDKDFSLTPGTSGQVTVLIGAAEPGYLLQLTVQTPGTRGVRVWDISDVDNPVR
jgi:hypothetical protein